MEFASYPSAVHDMIKGSFICKKLLSAVSLIARYHCNSFSVFCLDKTVVNPVLAFEGLFLLGFFFF